MNTLRKTGTILAASSAFLLAGCTAEQTSPSHSEATPTTEPSVAPTFSSETTSAPTRIAPEVSSDPAQIAATERQQKMQALLRQACGYVVQQEAHVKEGFPDV